MKNAQDRVEFEVRGWVTLKEFLPDGSWRPLAGQNNLVVDLAFDELFPQIFGRVPGAQIGIISIGEGGDYDANGVFVGDRVAPSVTDTEMRLELFRAGIVNIQFPNPNEVEFTGLIREAEAVSASIDEFGLLTTDGRMVAHSINPESAGTPSPTVKYTKPLGAIYAVTWTLTIDRCP